MTEGAKAWKAFPERKCLREQMNRELQRQDSMFNSILPRGVVHVNAFLFSYLQS